MKKNLSVLILTMFFALISFFFFQNCSKMSFSAADSSTAVGSQITDPVPFIDSSRTKIIYPETTEQQNNQKVKALIVVDNSATMTNSQNNLSSNISMLLNELSKYDSQVQVVSSTYSTKPFDCSSNECRATALYTYNSVNSTGSFVDPQGITRISSIRNESMTFNDVTTYQINPSQSAAQVADVTSTIANKIMSLGVKGSDSEKPFLVAVNQAGRFFNENDRGLIFIITDENDNGSVAEFPEYMSWYTEGANVYTQVPGYSYYVSRTGFTSFGSCNIVNEIGTVIGSNYINQGTSIHSTLADCETFVANSRPLCSLSCTSYPNGYSGNGPLAANQTLTSICNEIRSRLFPGETLSSCKDGTYLVNDSITHANEQTFQFGLTKDQFINAQSRPKGVEKLLVDNFKSKILNQLKEKYLISVATNIGAANCPLQTGQTQDSFFTSIKNYFPAQNFMVSSICDTAGSSAAGISKVAADFIKIINTQYLVGLAPGEMVKSAKIKLLGESELKSLSLQDYKIENGQFVLLNQAYKNFERIELLIDNK